MQLPRPIQTYFSAENGETLAAAFAKNAIVRDEGKAYHGPPDICDWWQASKVKYRHEAEPLDLKTKAGRSVVRARVSGDFPVLTFTFDLADELIANLEIR